MDLRQKHVPDTKFSVTFEQKTPTDTNYMHDVMIRDDDDDDGKSQENWKLNYKYVKHHIKYFI